MEKLASVSEWTAPCFTVEELSSADVALRWLQLGEEAFASEPPATPSSKHEAP
jgi:hypothetical protein